jgi:hypothetical protein
LVKGHYLEKVFDVITLIFKLVRRNAAFLFEGVPEVKTGLPDMHGSAASGGEFASVTMQHLNAKFFARSRF